MYRLRLGLGLGLRLQISLIYEFIFMGFKHYLSIYIYIYIYIVVILKWYISINRYQNISFFWSNQNGFRYEIDSFIQRQSDESQY